MATIAAAKTSPESVREFRKRHGLTAEEMDGLFGFSSNGRATRRWEAEDAPPYVGVLMGYIDKFGLDEAKRIAASRKTA